MFQKICLMIICFSSIAFAKINTVVSIMPQKAFVEAIGGELVNVEVMVLPGNSPHNYEPKPSQMKAIDAADLYFTIGVEFEGVWMKKFANQNKKMKIVNSTKDIKKIFMPEEHHAEDTNAKQHHHEHGGLDPHVWTSPANVKTIAFNIRETLSSLDPEHKAIYQANYEAFRAKIDATDMQIKTILKDLRPQTKFMVFHPSWGYFAQQYGLVQVAIEVEGKEPKPRELAQIIKEAKEEGVRAIFTQPEFSDKSARQIANELKIDVIKASPLALDWDNNLITLAKAIAHK